MKSKGSLPPSQESATCPYLRHINPVHLHLHPISWSSILILSSHLHLPRSSKSSLYLRFPYQNPVCTSSLPHMGYMPCLSKIFKTGMFIFRFENTITAIFNGHTHNDHFHVYYSTDEPTRPISVAINGGSVTPFTNLNTNYKIYSIDSATYVSISDEDRIQKFTVWSSRLWHCAVL
jgi:hypothetical protein